MLSLGALAADAVQELQGMGVLLGVGVCGG